MTTHLQVFSLHISMVCFGCDLKSINQSTNQLLCQILSVIQAGELNIFNVVIIMEHYKDYLLRQNDICGIRIVWSYLSCYRPVYV